MFKKIKSNVKYLLNTPQGNVRLHFWLTIIWLLFIPITIIWLRESILWVALLSVYANFVSSWACWQAARAECKVDKGNKAAKAAK